MALANVSYLLLVTVADSLHENGNENHLTHWSWLRFSTDFC